MTECTLKRNTFAPLFLQHIKGKKKKQKKRSKLLGFPSQKCLFCFVFQTFFFFFLHPLNVRTLKGCFNLNIRLIFGLSYSFHKHKACEMNTVFKKPVCLCFTLRLSDSTYSDECGGCTGVDTLRRKTLICFDWSVRTSDIYIKGDENESRSPALAQSPPTIYAAMLHAAFALKPVRQTSSIRLHPSPLSKLIYTIIEGQHYSSFQHQNYTLSLFYSQPFRISRPDRSKTK